MKACVCVTSVTSETAPSPNSKSTHIYRSAMRRILVVLAALRGCEVRRRRPTPRTRALRSSVAPPRSARRAGSAAASRPPPFHGFSPAAAESLADTPHGR